MKKMMIVFMSFFATAAFAAETAPTGATTHVNTNPSAIVRKAKRAKKHHRAARHKAKKHAASHEQAPAADAHTAEAPAGEAPSH